MEEQRAIVFATPQPVAGQGGDLFPKTAVAGTGNPFFTTDTAASLRAIEIGAEVLLKGTRVDGIYTADPEKYPAATKYDALTFNEAYERKLNVMDMTAFTLCRENNLPIMVFNVNTPGNLLRLLKGEKIGTIVS